MLIVVAPGGMYCSDVASERLRATQKHILPAATQLSKAATGGNLVIVHGNRSQVGLLAS